MRRRTFVTACGAAALAGCFGSDSEDPNDNASANATDGTGNETATNESGGGNQADQNDVVGARDPEPTEFSGSGSASTESFSARPGLTMIEVDPITGIAVDVIDAGGSVWRSLDWDLRNYQGLVPLDIPRGDYTIDVQTDRDWTIRVIQPEVRDGDLVTPSTTVSDSKPQYVGPIEFSEVESVAVNHTGVGEFSLKLYSLDGEYLQELHNQNGIFEADVTVNYGGQGWLVIAASSDYEVTIESDGGDTQPASERQTDGGGGSSSGNSSGA